MIPFTLKINERSVGQSISGEMHIIGILATATYSPGNIRLIEVPQGPFPAVTIPGYTEIPSGTPTGTQFVVNYTTGVVTFATAQDGNSVSVSYTGLGSEWAAEDVNELQSPLSTVAQQNITYNWPSAPTVTWTLTPNIVKPASISNTITDDFTFPRNVIVTGNVTVSNDHAVIFQDTGSNAVTLEAPTTITSSYTLKWPIAQSTGSQILTNDGSGNLSWSTASGSGTVNSGVAGALAYYATSTNAVSTLPVGATVVVGSVDLQNSVTQLQFIAGVNTSKITVTTPSSSNIFTIPDFGVSANFLFDTGNNLGPVGIGETPVASAILDVASTTKGFLPPRMTSTQRTAISSPASGLMVYDTTTNQWYGWNGTSWVILG